jgi:hypothetical protein
MSMSGKRKKPLFKRFRLRSGQRGGAHKVLPAIVAVVGLMFMCLGFVSVPASATPGGGSDVCGPLDSGKKDTTGDPQTVTVTAPEGKLIDQYCVKAGSSNQGDGPVYVDVNPPVKTVTFGYPGDKAVSHYSVSYTDAPTDECDKLDGDQPPGTDCTQPPDDRETRDLPGVVDCESDTYTVKHQERTREYSWDGDSWEPGPWSEWTTYDTTVTPATDEQCPDEPVPGTPYAFAVQGSCEAPGYIQINHVPHVHWTIDDEPVTVVAPSSKFTYPGGIQATVKAIPDEGWSFPGGTTDTFELQVNPQPSGDACEEPPTEIEIPATPSVNDPCGPNNATWNVPADTDTLDWELKDNGHLVVTVAAENTTFPGGATSHDFGKAPDSGENCPPTDECPSLTGSVKTTLSDGSVVNGNIYDNKSDVYIYGEQLGDVTTVYVRVTDPSGSTVLSDTKEVAVVNGSFGPVQLPTFDDTPNNGGEYKVWVSTSPDFENNKCTKFDNFKVRGEEPEEPEGNLVVDSECESITIGEPTGVKPEDADVVIKLDDVEVQPGTYAVEPGTHTVELFVDGEKVDSETLVVEECPVPPTEVPVPTQDSVDPCNPPGVTNNVDWAGPLPADTANVDWSESNDGTTRTATLIGNAEWSDGTTAPKVFTLPADSGLTCTPPEECPDGFQDENPEEPCYVEREPDVREESSVRESCRLGGVETTHTVFTTTYSFNEETQEWESSETATSSLSFDPYTAAELKEKGCVKSPQPDNPDNPDNPTFDTGLSGQSPEQGQYRVSFGLVGLLLLGLAAGMMLIGSPTLARARRR